MKYFQLLTVPSGGIVQHWTKPMTVNESSTNVSVVNETSSYSTKRRQHL